MVMWIGLIIVILTFALIIRRVESRAVLMVSGLILCAMGGALGGAFDAFNSQLLSTSMTPIICASMAFSAVMEYTKCSEHLVRAILKPLSKVRLFLVPFAVFVTFLINISVTSASGCAAAVGALLIPTLLALGVNPATAAASVLLATWAGNLNPGDAFTIQVADIAGVSPTDAWLYQIVPCIVLIVVGAIVLTAVDILAQRFSKKKGLPVEAVDLPPVEEGFKINPLKALCPVFPIVLVLLGTFGILPNLNLAIWMLIGSVIGMIVDWKNPTNAIKEFFSGAGKSFADIISLIACATLFTYGIEAVGLTDALINIMKTSTALARITSVALPFGIAALSGSGNAAVAAFNTSVLPHGVDLGLSIVAMGSCAKIAAAVGRAVSPVSGACIICARYAKTDSMNVTKRNILPGIVMSILLILFFM